MENIAFDSHKRYTVSSVEDRGGRIIDESRIEHDRGSIREYLRKFTPGSPVAVETIGNWYWIIDEIEEANMDPKLVHARKAKMMIGCINKTDKLDARGLNLLQRAGTLPSVWIPTKEIRDKRDLARTRMYLVNQRTCLKNRIHATLSRYALEIRGLSDAFGKRGRVLMDKHLRSLPEHTRFAAMRQIGQIDALSEEIKLLDEKMKEVFDETEEIKLLRTIPGIGFLLSIVVALEIGDVNRFSAPERLASYSGTTPRVHASGGKVRYGNLRPDVNRYLKWAFVEAANTISINRKHWPERHAVQLYNRIRHRKGHPKAIGAVARHLAEATFWILKRKEVYRDPGLKTVFQTEV